MSVIIAEIVQRTCEHPLVSRLQVAWYIQLCKECGNKIPCDIPSYPKDEQVGKTFVKNLKKEKGQVHEEDRKDLCGTSQRQDSEKLSQ